MIPDSNSATPEERLAASEAKIQILIQDRQDSDKRAENSAREAAALDAVAGLEFVSDRARASFVKEAIGQMERGPGGNLIVGSRPAKEGIREMLAGDFGYTLASARATSGTKARVWTLDDIKPGMRPEDLKAIQEHIQRLLPGRR